MGDRRTAGGARSRAAKFFARPAAFRAWLEKHHAAARELVVGFHKVGAGKPSITYPEALDEALCFGWIDGVRRSVDAARYTIRFTPRKPQSTWSAVNVTKALALVRAGRMHRSGLAAFEARDQQRTERHANERERAALSPAQVRAFKEEPEAWAFWQAQPPGYRKITTIFVTSAKKEETRARRLAILIDHSARGRRLPILTSPGKPAGRP